MKTVEAAVAIMIGTGVFILSGTASLWLLDETAACGLTKAWDYKTEQCLNPLVVFLHELTPPIRKGAGIFLIWPFAYLGALAGGTVYGTARLLRFVFRQPRRPRGAGAPSAHLGERSA